MARGKIRIKRIEDMTKRQITYSSRRNGLFKKAKELTSLCDVKVSIIMISSNGKLQEYISPSTTTNQMVDLYQKTHGIDLWSSHYERMEERLKELQETNTSLKEQISHRMGESLSNLSFDELRTLDREMENALETLPKRWKMQGELRKLKEKNRSLRMQISQRTGHCLNGLEFKELHELEEEMQGATSTIRERKYKVMTNQIETTNKKFKRAKQINSAYLCDLRYLEVSNGALRTDLDIANEQNHGVVDNQGVYDYGIPREHNQVAEAETKSVLTCCSSTSTCSVNQPNYNLDDESSE